MATLDLDDNRAQYQIRAFKPGIIQINDKIFTTSLLLTATQLISDWPPQTVAELKPESLAVILSMKPDILLIGTGATQVFLPTSLYGDLINAGIGVEVMDTGAACRTFNALTAENRQVMAALILK